MKTQDKNMSGATYCETHPDLVRLCTNCAHVTCPDGGCKQYRMLKQKVDPDRRQKKQVDEAQLVGTPEVLMKLSIAIKAIDDLMNSPDCDSVFSVLRLKKIRKELDLARNKSYGHLINWAHIARRME